MWEEVDAGGEAAAVEGETSENIESTFVQQHNGIKHRNASMGVDSTFS